MMDALTRDFCNRRMIRSTRRSIDASRSQTRSGTQLLRRDEAQGRINVSTNESDISGWTADEILRNFLEVPNPTDIDTAKHVIRLQELRRKDELSTAEAEELERLRHMVNQELVNGPIAARLEMEEILMQGSPSFGTKEEDPNDALG